MLFYRLGMASISLLFILILHFSAGDTKRAIFRTAVLEGCPEPIMAQWEPSLYSVQLKPFTLTKSILSFAFKPREFKPYPMPLLAVEQVLFLAYSQKPRSRGHVEVLNSQTLEPPAADRPGQQRSCYWLGENILWWANIWHTGFQLYAATGEFKQLNLEIAQLQSESSSTWADPLALIYVLGLN